MNGFRVAALLCLLGAIGTLGYAVATGAARVGLFLIVPFVTGTGLLPLLGMLLLFASFILFFMGSVRDAQQHAASHYAGSDPYGGDPYAGGRYGRDAGARGHDAYADAPPGRTVYREAGGGSGGPVGDERRARPRVKSGGVVLLGPIPIVWGSDRRILPWMVAAGGVLLVLALWLTLASR